MLAALMSSLASLFNSSASLFTVDIYQKIFPNRSQRELVFVGRLATTAIVGLGMLWIPIMKLISNGGLYQYLQSVQGYLAPSITAVFLLGLLWRRINAQGALWGMASGFILGMFKLIVQTFYGKGKIETPTVLSAIGDFNFLYTTVLLLLVSCAIMIVVSLLTLPPPAEKVEKLTYFSLYSNAEDAAELRASWDIWNKIFSAVIVLGVLGMYLYFSFWLV